MNRFSLIMLDYTPHKNFVKDNNNLLNYNVWSATDYTETITGFTNKPISSNEWSYTGERSLKLTRLSSTYGDYTTQHIQELLEYNNYKLTIKVYSPTGTGRIQLFHGTDATTTYVDINQSNQIQTLEIQVNNTPFRGFRLLSYIDESSIYFDDITLTTIQ